MDSNQHLIISSHQYFYKTVDDTENYYKVIRSWNYPKSFKSGTITNREFGVCFGSASCDAPIKSVIISPNRGGFNADAFNVGRIPGENEPRARHDAACALTNHLTMPSPSSPSIPVRYVFLMSDEIFDMIDWLSDFYNILLIIQLIDSSLQQVLWWPIQSPRSGSERCSSNHQDRWILPDRCLLWSTMSSWWIPFPVEHGRC